MLILFFINKIITLHQFSEGKKISINGLEIMLSDVQTIFRIQILPKFTLAQIQDFIDR